MKHSFLFIMLMAMSVFLSGCTETQLAAHLFKNISAFPYLQSLPLSYVKLHGRFTEDIESESTQFYLRSLINMAHSCDLQVYAENVETELEWQQYQRLGVDGGQGFYFGKPQQLGE